MLCTHSSASGAAGPGSCPFCQGIVELSFGSSVGAAAGLADKQSQPWYVDVPAIHP